MPTPLMPFIAPLLTLLVGAGVAHLWHTRKKRVVKTWPAAFNLSARTLFTTEERLMFRELKAALPNHVVLAKINLLRFCQANRDGEARLWFDRLHPLTVSFAVCTPNGTVVSAIDLEMPNRVRSDRGQRLKEAVLDACRIRYLRCQAGHRPEIATLAQWALGANHRQPAGVQSPLVQARAELAQKLTLRRSERAERARESSFQDSGFGDSFFALDSRFDLAANSAPAPLADSPKAQAAVSQAARR